MLKELLRFVWTLNQKWPWSPQRFSLVHYRAGFYGNWRTKKNKMHHFSCVRLERLNSDVNVQVCAKVWMFSQHQEVQTSRQKEPEEPEDKLNMNLTSWWIKLLFKFAKTFAQNCIDQIHCVLICFRGFGLGSVDFVSFRSVWWRDVKMKHIPRWNMNEYDRQSLWFQDLFICWGTERLSVSDGTFTL